MTPHRADQLLKLLEAITSELDGAEASPDRLDEILTNLKAIEAERSQGGIASPVTSAPANAAADRP